MVIFLTLMAEAFMGYVLPWGQMSYWGAQVIINLFGAIPWVGEGLTEWIRGDYLVSDATLNRFFALHVIALPLVILLLVVLHLGALHEVGSNNPDGVDIKKVKDKETGIPKDGIAFHPYYTVKDLFGTGFFLIIAAFILFFEPTFGGLFLEHDNFNIANPLVTPEHIKPVWYFTPYYAMLRAVPDKLFGVMVMGGATLILFLLPWLDRSPVKSIRYRPMLHKLMLAMFCIAFVVLGWLGMQAGSTIQTWVARGLTFFYFGFFVAMPIWSRMGSFKTVPERVTTHD
jgi:ubiquinol-cytochrome c reductase cytochrome b subunit